MVTTNAEESICEAVQELLKEHADPSVPLPSTRKLGKLLNHSHVTVSKALLQMSDAGELWRSETGRYYPQAARLIFDSPKPVACFVRSISAWASWYSQLMTGIGTACERAERALLVQSASNLILQDASDSIPTILSVAQQRELLDQFLTITQANRGLLILDDLWDDEALAPLAPRLKGARMLLRQSTVPGIESIVPDYAQAALLGISHLLAQGYDKVRVLYPFQVKAIDAMVDAFSQAANQIGLNKSNFEIIHPGPDGDTSELAAQLKAGPERVGVFCAEENFAVSLYHSLCQAGVSMPEQVGLIAGWGTGEAERLGLSSLRIDLQQLGVLAVELDSAAARTFRPASGFTLHKGIST